MTYNLYQFNMPIYFAQIATAITESILTYKWKFRNKGTHFLIIFFWKEITSVR